MSVVTKLLCLMFKLITNVVIVSIIVSNVRGIVALTCPSPFSAVGSGCYYRHPTRLEYTPATIACYQYNALIASVHSQAENNALARKYATFDDGVYSNALWIGATSGIGNMLSWNDNTTFNFAGATNIFPKIPNTCVRFNVRYDIAGLWDYVQCTNNNLYPICKYYNGTLPTTPSPTANPTFAPKVCPDQFTNINGKCIFAVPTGVQWTQANTVCNLYNAQLMSVTSSATNILLQDYLANNQYCAYYWMGNVYLPDKKRWVWIDNSTFYFTSWANGVAQTFSSKTCAYYYQQKWYPYSCDYGFCPLCQYIDGNIPTPSPSPVPTLQPTAASVTCPSGYTQLDGECYQLLVHPGYQWTYSYTLQYCRDNYRAYLPSIHSSYHNDMLLLSYGNSYCFWLGLSRVDFTSAWRWFDGTPLDYYHSSFNPSSTVGNCVAMCKGIWKVASCDIVDSSLSNSYSYYYGYWYYTSGYESYYICQYDRLSPTAAPSLMPTAAPSFTSVSCPWNFNHIDGSCYLYFDRWYYNFPWSFEYTLQYARDNYHAIMPTIHSPNHNDRILSAYGTSYCFWLGLRRTSASAAWIWVDGTPLDYVHTSFNPLSTVGNCVSMCQGLWTVTDCTYVDPNNNDYNYWYYRYVVLQYEWNQPTLSPTPVPTANPTYTDVVCPSGFTSINGQCYWYVSANIYYTGTDGELTCRSRNALLPSIHTAGENDLLAKQFWYFWLGLYLDSSGTWRWTDGTPVDYTNWAPQHPQVGSPWCAYMANGLWYSWSCWNNALIVCEYYNGILPGTTVAPTPSPTVGVVACRSPYRNVNGACYGMYSFKTSLRAADRNCATEDAFTFSATVLSQSTSVLLASQFGVEYWIGLSGSGVTNTWQWSDGSPVQYTNWDIGMPQAFLGMDCVYATSSGKWRNDFCSNVRKLLCQLRDSPTALPTAIPTTPTVEPSAVPSRPPTTLPTALPSFHPTAIPTYSPTRDPTLRPTVHPTEPTTASSHVQSSIRVIEKALIALIVVVFVVFVFGMAFCILSISRSLFGWQAVSPSNSLGRPSNTYLQDQSDSADIELGQVPRSEFDAVDVVEQPTVDEKHDARVEELNPAQASAPMIMAKVGVETADQDRMHSVSIVEEPIDRIIDVSVCSEGEHNDAEDRDALGPYFDNEVDRSSPVASLNVQDVPLSEELAGDGDENEVPVDAVDQHEAEYDKKNHESYTEANVNENDDQLS